MTRSRALKRREDFAEAAESWPLDDHLPFDKDAVAAAPQSPGVYLLYRDRRLVYIGYAPPGSTIRRCLEEQLRSGRAATEFDYEVSACAAWLYRHYIAVYLNASGGLMPECNDVEETWRWLSGQGRGTA